MVQVERGHSVILGLLILFSFIELVITAVLVSHNSRWSDSAGSRESFLLFVSTWTIVLGALYLVGFVKASGSFLLNIASHAAFLGLTFIFWLAGAAAITNTLHGGLNCSRAKIGYCGSFNASEAFAWINTIITFVALTAILMLGLKSSKNGTGWGAALV